MSGTTFTYPLAKRIVSSTKWTEEQRGIIPEIETPIILNGNQDLLVRTSSTLPVGYTGAMAVQGEIVEQKQDGTYVPQMPIWIRDQNGGTLSANTIYQARVGGTWTQDVTTNGITVPTTLGLYLVQQAIIISKEEHYYPKFVTLNNYYSIVYPGDTAKYFRIEPDYNYGSVIATYGFKQISNIVYNNLTFGPVQPILKVRYSGAYLFPDGNRYALYEWYSDPIWVKTPVQISGGKAVLYNTPVADYGGIAYAGGDGNYLCQWQLIDINSTFNSYSVFLDYIIPISKQTKPTIAGIGSGIGSGISGV